MTDKTKAAPVAKAPAAKKVPVAKRVDTTNVATSPLPGVADTALTKVDDLKPAIEVAASGAMIEPTIVDRIDTKHPAVDDEPRKGQPVVSNLIDFNDPTKSTDEAVADNLNKQAN